LGCTCNGEKCGHLKQCKNVKTNVVSSFSLEPVPTCEVGVNETKLCLNLTLGCTCNGLLCGGQMSWRCRKVISEGEESLIHEPDCREDGQPTSYNTCYCIDRPCIKGDRCFRNGTTESGMCTPDCPTNGQPSSYNTCHCIDRLCIKGDRCFHRNGTTKSGICIPVPVTTELTTTGGSALSTLVPVPTTTGESALSTLGGTEIFLIVLTVLVALAVGFVIAFYLWETSQSNEKNEMDGVL